jgi:signal recognition particle GTPase
MDTNIIRGKIYEIRGQKVMLDFDLAELYGVETRVFNQAVKRNAERFPEDFMFRLTAEEWERYGAQDAQVLDDQTDGKSSQNVMSSGDTTEDAQTVDNELTSMSSQIVMRSSGGRTNSRKKRAKAYLPYAFTEHGVSMLASVLKSEKAVRMSIAIVRAFIALKEFVSKQNAIDAQFQEIRDRLMEHDVQLSSIYDAIENLLDEKVNQKSWESRARIGFK